MGIKERKERERQQRVNEILEAARLLFEDKGFLNTTLQDVAQEAEISVGLIYRYFQSKEDMFASLALKGADEVDKEIDTILQRAKQGEHSVADILNDIATKFFAFYGPYGEYFDLLIYSYKGTKNVQIHANTMTRLMSRTLSSLDKLKTFILMSPQFKAQDEDEALRVVFLFWGIMLGCHKIFDSSGRGHLFAFGKETFIKEIIQEVLIGIGAKPETSAPDVGTDTSQETTHDLSI